MKLYVITVSDVQEGENYPFPPIVKMTRKEASKRLSQLERSAVEIYEGQYGNLKKEKDSFSLSGADWSRNHYDARIDVVRVPNVFWGGRPGAKKPNNASKKHHA